MCLQPVGVPLANAAEDPRRVDIESRLVAALRGAGFEVSDPLAVESAVVRAAETVPRRFDPTTGRPDRATDLARRAAIGTALRTELSCDARMLAEVVSLWAFVNSGHARWDGRGAFVNTAGRSILNVLGGVSESAHMTALSLWLRVLDLDANEIAFRSAGIEPLVQLAVGREVKLPADQWLTRTERLDSAIASALGPGGRALRLEGKPQPIASPPGQCWCPTRTSTFGCATANARSLRKLAALCSGSSE